jgi:hypothetical protein
MAGALALAGALSVLASAPAFADGTATWHAEGGVPASTSFSAVATDQPANSSRVVVAVGTDTTQTVSGTTTTTTNKAVIYSDVGDAGWQKDTITSLPDPTTTGCSTSLTGLALTDTAAWAIGTQSGASCPTAGPLIVRFPGGAAGLVTASAPSPSSTTPIPPSWSTQASRSEMGTLSAIALYPANSTSSDGLIGDSKGALYPITDDLKNGGAITAALTQPQTPPGAIHGIALYGFQTGYAVADDSKLPDGSLSGVRIFSIGTTTGSEAVSAAPFVPNSNAGKPPLAAVAALKATNARAIEASADSSSGASYYWAPDSSQAWNRQSFTLPSPDPTAQFKAISLAAPQSSSVMTALAGSDSQSAGVIWVQFGTAAPVTSLRVASALRGITALDANNMWAVGGSGTIEHLYVDPPKTTTTTTTTSSSTSGGGCGSSCSSTATTSSQSQPQIIVTQKPAPRPTTGKARPRIGRLLLRPRVHVERGRLVITFFLTARASVAVRALTGSRLVGAMAARTLARGNRRMVVHYRGRRPPTQLQIIVRPAAGGTPSPAGSGRGT